MEEDATLDRKPPPQPPPGNTAAAASSSALAAMGPGERLILFGAVLLVGVYLLFHPLLALLVLRYASMLPLAVGALAAIWLRHSRPATVWAVPYVPLVRVLAYAPGGLGVLEFVTSARFGYLDEPAYIVGAVLLAAGPVLMLLGARQLPSDGR